MHSSQQKILLLPLLSHPLLFFLEGYLIKLTCLSILLMCSCYRIKCYFLPEIAKHYRLFSLPFIIIANFK
jgi:hypothetical protein